MPENTGLTEVASLLVGAPEDNQAEGPGDETGDVAEGQQDTSTESAVTDSSSDQAEREGDPGGSEEGQAEEGETPERFTVSELAEKLGVDASDLYDSLEISLGEDSATLGELKDRAKDLAKSDERLQEAEEVYTTAAREAEQIRRGTAVALQHLGRKPTQQEIDEGNRRFLEYARGEASKLLTVVPEWKDQAVAAREHDKLSVLCREYEMTDMEISNIVDSRQIRILRDFALLRERVAEASQAQVRGEGRRQGKGRKPRARQQTTADKVKASVASGKMSRDEGALALILGANDNGSRQP